jgi:hypothetical protein
MILQSHALAETDGYYMPVLYTRKRSKMHFNLLLIRYSMAIRQQECSLHTKVEKAHQHLKKCPMVDHHHQMLGRSEVG